VTRDNELNEAKAIESRARTAAIRLLHQQLLAAEKQGELTKAEEIATTIMRCTTRAPQKSNAKIPKSELFALAEPPLHHAPA
jgi:hypothetical protein